MPRNEERIKMRNAVQQHWIRGRSDENWVQKILTAQKIVNDATFDQLMDNFDYYHAAQCYVNLAPSAIKEQAGIEWVDEIWFVSADEFIKSLDFNDEDTTMLKLAYG